MKSVRFNQEVFDEDMEIIKEELFSWYDGDEFIDDFMYVFSQFIFPQFCEEMSWEYYE